MKKTLFISISASLLLASCTNGLYKKGVKNYDKMAYANAIDNFEHYLQ